MDENIFVGFGEKDTYFWTRLDDTSTKHQIFSQSVPLHGTCIIDSTTADPTLAFVKNNTLTLYKGSQAVSTLGLDTLYTNGSLVCENNKLYVGM